MLKNNKIQLGNKINLGLNQFLSQLLKNKNNHRSSKRTKLKINIYSNNMDSKIIKKYKKYPISTTIPSNG